MSGILSVSMIYGLLGLVVIISLFMATSKLLSNYCVETEGHGSIMAYIPIVRLYLLGKYIGYKFSGFVLMFIFFLTGEITITIDNVEKTYSILPNNISKIVSYVFFGIEALLFIILYLKMNKLVGKKIGEIERQTSGFNQNDAIMKSLEKTPSIENYYEKKEQVITDANINNNSNNNASNIINNNTYVQNNVNDTNNSFFNSN